jgi:Putative Ig domain
MGSRARRQSFSTAGRVSITPSAGALAGYTWRQNVAIAQATLGTLGGGTGTFVLGSITPALPSGLTATVSGAGLLVNGTPATVGSDTRSVIVTDTGRSAPANMSFAAGVVTAVAATVLQASASWTAGVAVTPFAPASFSGGTGTYTISINPSLPSGMSINASTGVISGTPVADSSGIVYTVTGTDSLGGTGGTATAAFDTTAVGGGGTYTSSGSDFASIVPPGISPVGTLLQFDIGNAPAQSWTFQWYRTDGTAPVAAIGGATQGTYQTVNPADADKIISAVATGSVSGALTAYGVYISA